MLQVNLCQKLLFLHQLTHNMTTDCSLNYKCNTWKFQAQTWGEHVVYRNCFWHSEQFLYTTCSPHVLQKEELLTKIYLYIAMTRNKYIHIIWISLACPCGLKVYPSLLRIINYLGNNLLGNQKHGMEADSMKLRMSFRRFLAWHPKILQTKILVIDQRFGDLFSFGLVW